MPSLPRSLVSGETGLAFRQFLQFGVVGASGFAVNVAVVYLLRGAVGLAWAGLIAYFVAATTNWALNRVWTFRSARRDGLLRQWLMFLAAEYARLRVELRDVSRANRSIPALRAAAGLCGGGGRGCRAVRQFQPLAPIGVSLKPRIAVLVPCYNEQVAIPSVVRDFRAALPEATIYVYDNNSRDGTVEAARAAGAVVRTETLQGKGHVVRRMFADIEADAYVLVDGDATYDAGSAPEMVRLLLEQGLDMVNGARVTDAEAAYRPGHRFGNHVLTGMVPAIFGNRISDMLSGYRVFSRRFVKSFPALSGGFETETEFTIHALELAMPIGEVPTPYRERPAGSQSKLNTYADGLRILRTILLLVKEERPLQFFSIAALVLMVIALISAIPVFSDYMRTGLVPRLPTAVLATGLVLLGVPIDGLRLDPRHRVARAQGAEAAGLPGHPRLPAPRRPVAVGMLEPPVGGGAHDVVELREARRPASLLADPRGGRDQDGRITGSPRAVFVRDRPPEHALDRVDHVLHRVPGAVAEIVGHAALVEAGPAPADAPGRGR